MPKKNKKTIDTQERNEQIREFWHAGWTQTDIAAKFDLNPGHVSRICRFKTEVDDPQQAAKIQRLTDGQRYAKKRLKEGLRNESIITEITGIALDETRPFRPVKPPKQSKRANQVSETLCLLLSDGHHDQVVRPEEVNGLENYNFHVSLRRAEQLVDTVIRFANQTLSNYHFDRLVVFSLGDNTSGEIHDAERASAFGNQFKNCLAIGALHGAMIRDLAAHFNHVDVIGLSGNHGRKTNRKQYKDGAHNNWDYMVNKLAEQHNANQKNVRFHIPNSWDTIVDVEGYQFHASHGDDVASSGGKPWQGLETMHRNSSGIHKGSLGNRPFRNARDVDYYVIGHHHTIGCVDGNGVGYICNGSWPGTDAYAYQSLRVAGRPQQLLFGVHRDHGKTWSLPVHLDGRDQNPDCRYDGIVGCVTGLAESLAHPRLEGVAWE